MTFIDFFCLTMLIFSGIVILDMFVPPMFNRPSMSILVVVGEATEKYCSRAARWMYIKYCAFRMNRADKKVRISAKKMLDYKSPEFDRHRLEHLNAIREYNKYWTTLRRLTNVH